MMSDMFPSDHGRGTRGEWRDHAEHVGRRTDKLAADFDARRATRLTGHRSLFRRLLDRLRHAARNCAATRRATTAPPAILAADLSQTGASSRMGASLQPERAYWT
jgi:hypothetical protein